MILFPEFLKNPVSSITADVSIKRKWSSHLGGCFTHCNHLTGLVLIGCMSLQSGRERKKPQNLFFILFRVCFLHTSVALVSARIENIYI